MARSHIYFQIMGRYENFKATLEAENCIILIEKSLFEAEGRLSFKCEAGHIRDMSAAAFNNKVAKIKRGLKRACASCEAREKAEAELGALGHELLEYKNDKDVLFKCGNCGGESHSNMPALRKGTGVCIKCMNRERRATFDDVVNECKVYGFELLEYDGNKKIRAKCPCGSMFEGPMADIRRGRKCKECAGARREQTNLERYGCANVMHNRKIFEKTIITGFSTKLYKFPSGKEVYVQGYETNAINYCLKFFSEEDIQTKSLPVIYYNFEGRIRAYHPDIFILSENCIIEVKSIYTLCLEFDKNMAKFEAVKKSKYKFRLLVFEKAVDIEPFEDFMFE